MKQLLYVAEGCLAGCVFCGFVVWLCLLDTSHAGGLLSPTTVKDADKPTDMDGHRCCVDGVTVCWGEDDSGEPGDRIVIRNAELCDDDAYCGRLLDVHIRVDCTGALP